MYVEAGVRASPTSPASAQLKTVCTLPKSWKNVSVQMGLTKNQKQKMKEAVSQTQTQVKIFKS